MGIVDLLDDLPETVQRPAQSVWSVLARSLGEQGASGRTALAWRWALTGSCPSPVTLSAAQGSRPGNDALISEADAEAELGRADTDQAGDVMQAKFVLRWLAGDLDALPLWNGGPKNLHVTDGAAYARPDAELDEVYSWATLAEWQHPWPANSTPIIGSLSATGSASGTAQLMEWICGGADQGPLAATRSGYRRPSLYEVSVDVRHAMDGLIQARQAGNSVVAARIGAIMETFAWLAGWSSVPPVDRHGHVQAEECAERHVTCACGDAGSCLATDCLACCQALCVHGFGQNGVLA